MMTGNINNYLLSESSTPVQPSRRVSPWHDWRHRAINGLFKRVLRRISGALIEPDGLPTTGIHRILICRPNHRLGNTILISPLIAEVEALYPGAQIDLLGSSATESLYAGRFRVHRVFVLPQKIARHLIISIKALRELRRCRYDLAIDVSLGSQSGRLVLALAQSRYKLGFPDQNLHPESAWFKLAWPEHLAHRSVFLLRQAYAGTTSVDYPELNLDLSHQEKQDAARVLSSLCTKAPNQCAIKLAIFPNATGAKRYGQAWWSRFVETFQTLCPDVILIDLLAAHGESQLGSTLTPFYTQNLRRLASMIACVDGFISADCGVMHLAAASGTPTLGLFSVTDPAKYAPYGNVNTAMSTHEMDGASAAIAAAAWLTSAVSKSANTEMPPLAVHTSESRPDAEVSLSSAAMTCRRVTRNYEIM